VLGEAALEVVTFIVIVIVIPAFGLGLWVLLTRPWGKP